MKDPEVEEEEEAGHKKKKEQTDSERCLRLYLHV